MPAALLLINKNATVTVCHSRTRDLPAVVRQADILIAAIVGQRWCAATGSSPVRLSSMWALTHSGCTKKSGHRLVGDVKFDEAREVAGYHPRSRPVSAR